MRKYLLILLLYPALVHSQTDSITVKVPIGDPTGIAPMGTRFMTIPEPSAIRYLKINANNSISLRTAAESLTDIGAQVAGSYLATDGNGSALTGLTKGQVGLGNVDNTSNATERAATATLTNKTLTSPVINTPTGIVKGDVGLGNVDNTTDAGKPVSTAQQTALNLKANLSGATFTGSIGYASGTGGTVTQATNKTTGVTLNKQCGQITMNGAALAAAAEVAFTLTNSTIAATDVVIVNVQSVGTAGAYFVTVGAVANGSCSITVGNASAGSLSQAVVLNYCVIKGVNN